MALKLNKTTPTGVYPEAYLRIARIELSRPLDGEDSFTAYYQVWSSQAFREQGGECIDNNGCGGVPSADVAEAYTYLKTLPEFEGAIDC